MENNKEQKQAREAWEAERQKLIDKVFSDSSVITIEQAMEAGLTFEEAAYGVPTWMQ